MIAVCVCVRLPPLSAAPACDGGALGSRNQPTPPLVMGRRGDTTTLSLFSLSLAYATVSTEHSQFHKRCVIRTFCQLIFKYSFWLHSFFSPSIHSLVWFLAIKKKKDLARKQQFRNDYQQWRNIGEMGWRRNGQISCVRAYISRHQRPLANDDRVHVTRKFFPASRATRLVDDSAFYIFVKCCTTSVVFTRKRLDDRRSDSLKFVDQRDMMNYRLKLLSKAQRMIVG